MLSAATASSGMATLPTSGRLPEIVCFLDYGRLRGRRQRSGGTIPTAELLVGATGRSPAAATLWGGFEFADGRATFRSPLQDSEISACKGLRGASMPEQLLRGLARSRGLDCLPYRCWRRRHVQVRHAERREGVDEGVHHGRRRTDGAGFAGALDAQRVGLAGDLDPAEGVARQVVGARHGVVHEGGGEQLAVLVVDSALDEGLAQALA